MKIQDIQKVELFHLAEKQRLCQGPLFLRDMLGQAKVKNPRKAKIGGLLTVMKPQQEGNFLEHVAANWNTLTTLSGGTEIKRVKKFLKTQIIDSYRSECPAGGCQVCAKVN